MFARLNDERYAIEGLPWLFRGPLAFAFVIHECDYHSGGTGLRHDDKRNE